jgi:hypothetical protein
MINKGGDATVKAIYYLIIICCLNLIIGSFMGTGDSQANPCMQMVMGGTTGTTEPPSTCTTQAPPTDMGPHVDYSEICTNTAQNDWFYSKFVATADTGTVCKICLDFSSSSTGSPTYNITAHLYSAGATYPDAAIGTYSTENLTGRLSNAGYTTICFDGDTTELTNGTSYFIVLNCSDMDLTNRLRVSRDDTCTTEHIGISADGSSWTSTSTARCATATLWK